VAHVLRDTVAMNTSVDTCASLAKRRALPAGVYIHVKHTCLAILGRPDTRHVLDVVDGAEHLQGFDGMIASTQAQIDEGRLWRFNLRCKVSVALPKTVNKSNVPAARAAQNSFCDTHPCLAIPHMANLPCTTMADPPSPRVHGVSGFVGASGDTCSNTRAERASAFPDALLQSQRAAPEAPGQLDAYGFCSLMEKIDVALVWKMSNDRDKPCERFELSVLANRPAIIHSFYECAAEIEGAAPFRCNDTACALRTAEAIRGGALDAAFGRLRVEVELRNAQIPDLYKALVSRVSRVSRESPFSPPPPPMPPPTPPMPPTPPTPPTPQLTSAKCPPGLPSAEAKALFDLRASSRLAHRLRSKPPQTTLGLGGLQACGLLLPAGTGTTSLATSLGNLTNSTEESWYLNGISQKHMATFRQLRLIKRPCAVMTVRDPYERLRSGFRHDTAHLHRKHHAMLISNYQQRKTLSELLDAFRNTSAPGHATVLSMYKNSNLHPACNSDRDQCSKKRTPATPANPFLYSQMAYLLDSTTDDTSEFAPSIHFLCTFTASSWRGLLSDFGVESSVPAAHVLTGRSATSGALPYDDADARFVRDCLYPWDVDLYKRVCGG